MTSPITSPITSQTLPATSLPSSATIHDVRLANGIRLLVYPNPHVQTVVVTGSVVAGSRFESAGDSGLASMMADGLMRGTQQHDFDALHQRLADTGANLGYSAGRSTVSFSGKALSEDLPLLLELLDETLRQPTFPDEQVEQLKAQRITGLRYNEDNSRYRADQAFSTLMFPPDHPYHYPVDGTLDTVPLISAGHLRNYHRAVIGPRGMLLVIVGAIDPLQVEQEVRQRFETWQMPDQPALPALPPSSPIEARRSDIDLKGKTQTDLVMGGYGPRRSDDDHMAAALANSVLGSFGMMGRIGHVIREQRGWAYYASSSMSSGRELGTWRVYAGVAAHNVEETLAAVRDELRRFSDEPLPEDELQDNKTYVTGRLPLRLESSGGLAGMLYSMAYYDLGLDYLLTYRDEVMQLSAEALQDTVRRYLDPNRLLVATAGPVLG